MKVLFLMLLLLSSCIIALKTLLGQNGALRRKKKIFNENYFLEKTREEKTHINDNSGDQTTNALNNNKAVISKQTITTEKNLKKLNIEETKVEASKVATKSLEKTTIVHTEIMNRHEDFKKKNNRLLLIDAKKTKLIIDFLNEVLKDTILKQVNTLLAGIDRELDFDDYLKSTFEHDTVSDSEVELMSDAELSAIFITIVVMLNIASAKRTLKLQHQAFLTKLVENREKIRKKSNICYLLLLATDAFYSEAPINLTYLAKFREPSEFVTNSEFTIAYTKLMPVQYIVSLIETDDKNEQMLNNKTTNKVLQTYRYTQQMSFKSIFLDFKKLFKTVATKLNKTDLLFSGSLILDQKMFFHREKDYHVFYNNGYLYLISKEVGRDKLDEKIQFQCKFNEINSLTNKTVECKALDFTMTTFLTRSFNKIEAYKMCTLFDSTRIFTFVMYEPTKLSDSSLFPEETVVTIEFNEMSTSSSRKLFVEKSKFVGTDTANVYAHTLTYANSKYFNAYSVAPLIVVDENSTIASQNLRVSYPHSKFICIVNNSNFNVELLMCNIYCILHIKNNTITIFQHDKNIITAQKPAMEELIYEVPPEYPYHFNEKVTRADKRKGKPYFQKTIHNAVLNGNKLALLIDNSVGFLAGPKYNEINTISLFKLYPDWPAQQEVEFRQFDSALFNKFEHDDLNLFRSMNNVGDVDIQLIFNELLKRVFLTSTVNFTSDISNLLRSVDNSPTHNLIVYIIERHAILQNLIQLNKLSVTLVLFDNNMNNSRFDGTRVVSLIANFDWYGYFLILRITGLYSDLNFLNFFHIAYAWLKKYGYTIESKIFLLHNVDKMVGKIIEF